MVKFINSNKGKSISSMEIQNEDQFPPSHNFIYNGKKFPFIFNYFKLSSKYFNDNMTDIEHQENVNLLDESTDKPFLIPEQIIYDFINYVQHQKIILTNENVVLLYYLGMKYKVDSLIKNTNQYLKIHHEELILPLLIANQMEPAFRTEEYEKIISHHLLLYVQNNELLKLNIPILYRILDEFYKEERNKEEKEAVNGFLFKVLKQKGRKASVLFTFLNPENAQNEHINRLLTEFANEFDFHYINNETQSQIYEEINKLKTVYENHSQIYEEINKLKTENSELKKSIKLIKDENEVIKNQLNEMKTNENINEKIDEMKREIASLKTDHCKSIEKLTQENIKLKKEIEDLKDFLNPVRGMQSILYESGKEFRGIINHLQSNGNIENELKITSSPLFSSESADSPMHVIQYNNENYFRSESVENAFICFEFITKKVNITAYTIKTASNNCIRPRSWVIEILNDNSKWIKIDEQNEVKEMNSYNVTKTFQIKNIQQQNYRFIRLRQTEQSWYGNRISSHILVISSIEFYGYLI